MNAGSLYLNILSSIYSSAYIHWFPIHIIYETKKRPFKTGEFFLIFGCIFPIFGFTSLITHLYFKTGNTDLLTNHLWVERIRYFLCYIKSSYRINTNCVVYKHESDLFCHPSSICCGLSIQLICLP